MISIIIPTKDRSVKLARALTSIAAQTYTAHEVVVVDDGSCAEEAAATARCVASYAGARLIRLDQSVGAPSARNMAVEASTGSLIAFLDSDDWWAPHRLALHRYALSAPDVALSYNPARLTRSTQDAAFGGYGKPAPRGRSLHVALAAWNFVGGCSSVCMTRSGFDAVGGFDPALPSCQDWDLWRRLAATGRFVFVKDAVTYQDVGPHERITTSRVKVEAGHDAMERAAAIMVLSRRDRRYVRAHQVWVRAELAARFGDTAQAVRLLGQSLLTQPTWAAASRLPSLLRAASSNVQDH